MRGITAGPCYKPAVMSMYSTNLQPLIPPTTFLLQPDGHLSPPLFPASKLFRPPSPRVPKTGAPPPPSGRRPPFPACTGRRPVQRSRRPRVLAPPSTRGAAAPPSRGAVVPPPRGDPAAVEPS
ncbi:hypothetical protein PVAP13_2NG112238 [Panicum virgatum]|uniref:Uncharacterized protein n=1 Tax=Panicum virgatum TaxID=38727 RepID=A0A8T0V7Y0_PANVG|nr:hypothetical protein PVAP13_2NG112238 [Panicum virgatum]